MAEPNMTDEERVAASERRRAALTESYTKALATLRENHLDEFNKLRQIEARNLGVDWSPKLTPEQAAAAEIEAHLQVYPHLRELFAPADAQSISGGAEDA